MGGPLRRVLIWQIFRTMRQRADAERFTGIDAVVVQVRGGRHGRTDRRSRVAVTNGQCKTPARAARPPTLAGSITPVAFLKLVGGASGPWRLRDDRQPEEV